MTNATNGTQPHSLGFAIEHLRARWGEIVAFGALLVVLGVAALCFTLPSTVATVTLNGVFFLVAGVAEIGVGAHAKSWARFFLWIIGGAIYLIAGLICIINPIFASLALTLALGAGLIAAAVGARLSRLSSAGRQSARHGAARRGGHLPARPGDRRPLADRLRSMSWESCSASICCFMELAGRPSGSASGRAADRAERPPTARFRSAENRAI